MPGLLHQQTEEQKINYLAQLVEAYLLKDIKSLVKEENVRSFNSLLFHLAHHQGSITSTSSLAKEISMHGQTIDHYLEIMAQTFTLYPVISFATNFSNELKKSKKYYLYDLGIRNLLCKNFAPLEKRDDRGILAESFVHNMLERERMPNVDLNF